MSKLTLTMPNGRVIIIINLSLLQIDFYRCYGLYALKYSDDFSELALICTHKDPSVIFEVYNEISVAYKEGKSYIKL